MSLLMRVATRAQPLMERPCAVRRRNSAVPASSMLDPLALMQTRPERLTVRLARRAADTLMIVCVDPVSGVHAWTTPPDEPFLSASHNRAVGVGWFGLPSLSSMRVGQTVTCLHSATVSSE